MLYESDITSLIGQWQERAGSGDYGIAIKECINDLESLIDRSHEEENKAREAENSFYDSLSPKEVEEIFLERQADDYLAECQEQWYS